MSSCTFPFSRENMDARQVMLRLGVLSRSFLQSFGRGRTGPDGDVVEGGGSVCGPEPPRTGTQTVRPGVLPHHAPAGRNVALQVIPRPQTFTGGPSHVMLVSPIVKGAGRIGRDEARYARWIGGRSCVATLGCLRSCAMGAVSREKRRRGVAGPTGELPRSKTSR